MHITIIGSGAFACALAHLLSKNNTNTIHIWTHDKNWKEISEKKKHYLLFDQQYPIKDNTIIHTDLTESIKKSTIIFLAISSQFFPSITEHLKETPLKNKTIFIGTKAMISHYPFFLTSYLKKQVKASYIGSFGGPNLAQDILNNAPISMVFSIKNIKTKKELQQILPSSIKINYLRNSKIIELSNTMKNIYAIGSGIILELTSSKSTNLSYLSASFMELTKAMNYLFKIKEPFIEELMGDFFLTGTMSESRNLSFGQALTLGKKDDFLKNNTVEGYVNIDAINIYLKEKKMSLPIFNTLYLITKKEGNPSLILSSFLSD